MENDQNNLVEKKEDNKSTKRVWIIVSTYLSLFLVMFIYALKINK